MGPSPLLPRYPCVLEALVMWSVLPRVEINVFDGQVPVRIQDFEAALFFFLIDRIMVLFEERQEFFRVAPLRFVVVLNYERLIFSVGGNGALLRSSTGYR